MRMPPNADLDAVDPPKPKKAPELSADVAEELNRITRDWPQLDINTDEVKDGN